MESLRSYKEPAMIEEVQLEARAPSIERIVVRELFGRYSYDLISPVTFDEDLSRILILYGDNGSGKTTILRLLYDLLSPTPRAGHRTRIAEVPFRQFSVLMRDGTSVSATRSSEHLTGGYHLLVSRGGITVADAEFNSSEELNAASNEEPRNRFDTFLDELKKLELDIYFLADDRRVYSDSIETRRKRRRIRDTETGFVMTFPETYTEDKFRGAEIELQEAIDRATGYIQQQAFRASNIGAANANGIYADVVRRIAQLPAVETSDGTDVEKLRKRLGQLEERTKQFEEYGFISAIAAKEFLVAFNAGDPERLSIITSVLEPYLDGIEARLDALEDTRQLVSTFEESVNSFYADKHLAFDLRRGMRVLADDGAQLDPSQLSSGERQLLLLLCHTLYARSQATVFIIDEPEISLNVKWQRKLVDALLACTRGSAIQFIMASHSMELIAGFSASVVKLENRSQL
jgi:energy-coupling factor transporter ATP-binding protein EcfA2